MATNDDVSRPALPPQAVLYQLSIGHYVARALHVAAKLGIADLLKDGPRPVGELAEATATHAQSLARVLRLLVTAGVFAGTGQLNLVHLNLVLMAAAILGDTAGYWFGQVSIAGSFASIPERAWASV